MTRGMSALTLGIAAAANLLFLLTFLVVLTVATGQAAAEERCTGQDMVRELKADEPALVAQIRAEAARTRNGKGLLWSVEEDDAPTSYIFGTMHMTDPRVVELPDGARQAFEAADTVVIETTDVLDQNAMMSAMAKRPELMMFTGEAALTDHLTDEQVATVDEALEERGVPLGSVKKMKPWMLVSLVALPACELNRKSAGAPVLDARLAADAEAEGKELAGLERVTEQLEAMASLPMDLHVRGLVDTLKLGKRVDDMIETMIVLYEQGETGMFWPFFNAVLPAAGDDASGYADFEEAVVRTRNHTMAERATPFLDEGGAFIAVGALHLPGEEGLVALLRGAGYTVRRLD